MTPVEYTIGTAAAIGLDPTPESVPVRGLGFGVPKPPVASPWRTP